MRNFDELLKGNQLPGWRAMMKVRKIHSGEDNHNSKLTKEDVASIRNATPVYGYMAKLARKYNITHAAVRKILKSETWKYI